MPAESEAQRKAAAMAAAIKEGKQPASKARGAVRSMLSMSHTQLTHLRRKP